MKDSYYKDKLKNYGISHTRLRRILSLVEGEKKLKILDIGCGVGRLGRVLKQNGHFVCGIDISEKAVNVARGVIDYAYVSDIEKEWSPIILEQKFDLVLLTEILEHIFDPVDVLNNVRRVLDDKGEIIVTTPNFMTWTNRVKFLVGRFSYQEEGMFDFGHIRWFTYSYLKKILDASGFSIVEEKHIVFPGKLTRILKHWPGLFASQFIIKAKKI